MKQLFLLRHAKSDWSHPGLTDFDRPLNSRGLKNAPEMGRRLVARQLEFDALVCSPAKRAATTARLVAAELELADRALTFAPEIYDASVAELLAVVRDFPPQWHRVLLVGHNPGMTLLANLLADAGIDNLPTAGLVGIELAPAAWAQIDAGGGELTLYDFPRKPFPA